MLKKMSIRWRITLYSVLLLTLCCILLTCILNFFAFRMADTIEAAQTTPASSISETAEGIEIEEMLPVQASREVQDIKWGFSFQSLLYMALIILGGSALTYFITGKALQPLQKLNIQVKNMTVSNLSETLSVTDANDEIAELTRSFNEMTDKLNDAFVMQQQFSANAAHELRTPLAVLQTKVDVFKKNDTHTIKEYEALLVIFEKQIGRLRSLVKTLLDMTTIEDLGEQTTVPLREILEDIITELTPVADTRHIGLFLDCEEYLIEGNLDLLYRTFYNLIENGIKYNKDNGTVTVTVKQKSSGQTEILICDTGIGIPGEMKKHVFEPFFRVDKSRSRSMGGAGLGLAMAERIITKHNGSIAISDNENGGTCFHVLL